MFLERSLPHVGRNAGSSHQQRIHAEMHVRHTDMTAVEAARHRLYEVLVVVQRAAVPIQPSHLVDSVLESEVGIPGLGSLHSRMHRHGVAGQMERKVRLRQLQIVNVYLPVGRAFRRILGHRVVQCDIQAGILQTHRVYFHTLALEVYAMALQVETAYIALDAGSIDEVRGVHLGFIQFQCIHLHLPFQQRPQLHIGHQPLHVGHGVGRNGRLDHLEPVQFQVEGESQSDMIDGNVHPRLLRRIRGHSLHHPVLYRRTVKQGCQDDKQNNRREQHGPHPFPCTFHFHLQSKRKKSEKRNMTRKKVRKQEIQ